MLHNLEEETNFLRLMVMVMVMVTDSDGDGCCHFRLLSKAFDASQPGGGDELPVADGATA